MAVSRSKVFLKVNRVDTSVCERARAVGVSNLHEAYFSLYGKSGLMSSQMRPHRPGAKIVGPAVTASCVAGDNLMMHRSLYLARPGDVLVAVCAAATSAAQWGDLASRYAARKGMPGVIVDGCVRDTDTIRSLGFPVWSTHVSAVHPEKRGPGLVNAPVVCDGVPVAPGDLVMADGDGAICIPRQLAARVVERAFAHMQREQGMAEAIAGGASLWELSGAAASYAATAVDEFDTAFDDEPGRRP